MQWSLLCWRLPPIVLMSFSLCASSRAGVVGAFSSTAGASLSSASTKEHQIQFTKQQVILISRKIRKCRNVTECLDLLHELPLQFVAPAATGAPTGGDATNTKIQPVVGKNQDLLRQETQQHLLLLEPAYLETLGALNYAQRKRKGEREILLQQALKLCELCPTEAVRARTISFCGQHGGPDGFEAAINLLNSNHFGQQQFAGIQSVNAALGVCSQAKEWQEALRILQQQHQEREDPGEISTLSCNIVLTAMERAKQGAPAMEFLLRMIDEDDSLLPPPDRSSFHHVMNALIATRCDNVKTRRVANVDTAYNLLQLMVSNSVLLPNNQTFDLLVRAYGRAGDWDMAGLVEELRSSNITSSVMPAAQLRASVKDGHHTNKSSKSSSTNLNFHWENDQHGMTKVGRGDLAYWEFASYKNPESNASLTIALQPHRNPSKNGIKILLIDDDNPTKQKLGFLLMINCAQTNTSTLLGVFLDPSIRKFGLSKVIIAIWMDICQQARLSPRTGVMNKPLLALVLQQTFGFVHESRQKPGVLVEVSPGTDCNGQSAVELYAPSLKSLQGAFGASDLERENIRVLTHAPSPRGRSCRVGTTLAVVDEDSNGTSSMESVIARELAGRSGKCQIVYRSEDAPWRSICLGSKA